MFNGKPFETRHFARNKIASNDIDVAVTHMQQMRFLNCKTRHCAALHGKVLGLQYSNHDLTCIPCRLCYEYSH